MSPIEQPPQNDEDLTPDERRLVDPAVLADHRARRTTTGEGSLLERLNRAEQDRVLLAARLADVEHTLERTERDRRAIATELGRRERDLRSSQQREFAEQKRRVEIEDELVQARREANDELDRLRRELYDAEDRIAEIGRELARTRREAAAGARDAAELRARVEMAEAAAADAGRSAPGATDEELARGREETARLADALHAERAARSEVEAVLESERERAAAEVTLLQSEIDRRAEQHARVVEHVAELRAQIAGVPGAEGEDVESAQREAAMEALVAEVVEASTELRTGFEQELAATEERLRAEVDEERARFAAELVAVESRVSDLRTQLSAAAVELRTQLEAEQTARRAAEEELARERVRHATERSRAGEVAGRARSVARDVAEPADAPHRAEGSAPASDPQAGPAAPAATPDVEVDVHTASLIADLQRAADRLRAQVADAEGHEDVPDGARRPPEGPQPSPERSGPTRGAGASPAIDLEIVESRRTAGPTRSPWLAEVVGALAAEEPARAAAALETLLPALAARARHRVLFDLTCEGVGGWRVALAAGRADVARRPPGPAGDVDFTVAGGLDAILPLACGGAQRRLTGVEVSGRRRRLRRLLRDLRQPLGLPELALSGVPADAGVLLGLLVRALPPGALTDASMVVDYDVAGVHGGRWHVTVAEGRAAVAAGAPATTPTARVHVADVAVAALLAGAAPPPGERVVLHGSRAAVDRLHRAFDVVQGQA